jgi:hypothetical protein
MVELTKFGLLIQIGSPFVTLPADYGGREMRELSSNKLMDEVSNQRRVGPSEVGR